MRRGVVLAESLEAKLRTRPDLFSVFTPARFALVTLRVRADDEPTVNDRTRQLHDTINAGGAVYLTGTVIDSKFVIRVHECCRRARRAH